ncbi:MAG: 4Fe-4S binding protein [Desulfobacterales bacterium]|nr:MAG: 4Fe-4S binding protein [Desulfobacterales bacterium]
MKFPHDISNYFRNIYESVTTIASGMWITYKTAMFERKVTLQYPSHDPVEGRLKDQELFPAGSPKPPFEHLLGAGQSYKGPLRPRLSERYRGLLGYDEPKCISCLLCAQICPIDVITVKGIKIEGRKTKAPVTYTINYAKCMFCGLCVEICPTDAVFFTRRFEGATFNFRSLVTEFISAELRRERLELAAEAKQKAAQNNKGKDIGETGNF